ncbi:MAG: DUF1254 domain-containing protein [Planctomyces sp.]|nr:DUF1254 domain-containing protein [Planctomyces sp.]
MKTCRVKWVVTFAAAFSLAAASARPGWAEDKPLNAEEASQLAVDAYVYGYPLITMEYTRRVMTNVAEPQGTHAPMGQFLLMRSYPDASFRDVTAPNADTLYSTAWLDLKQEPYVLSLPDEADRYFLMPMLDGWTNVFQVPGKRTTGTKRQTIVIAGPGWRGETPAGATVYHSPTCLIWILGRTYCTGTPEDYRAAHAVMDQYRLVPLSSYGKPYTPPKGKVDPAIDTKTPVREQVNRLSAAEYFQLLAKLLVDNPPAEADAAMVEKLARLGIVAGQPFDPSQLPQPARAAVEAAPPKAFRQIMGHFKSAGKDIHGWVFTTETGQYGTEYLQRALITAIGLGANRPQDAVYPTSEVDATGQAYSGANNYVMHFPKGQTPPVEAFWSITMYDADYFFVDNPLNKYTVSPRDKLVYNSDGSLDLYIQHESPGKEKEANWLPAPKDRFLLMMRLYWPKESPPSILDGSWEPPAVRKTN